MAGELDAKLWSELPGEVLDLVLRRLPLSSLCRFRAVCKHWNTLPTVRPSDPYLLNIPRDLMASRCSLYSPTANTWETLDLSFLPSQVCSLSHWTPRIERFCSDGGLLCLQGHFLERAFVNSTIPLYFLVLCNPLTRCSKLLPSFETLNQTTVDLVMHRDCSGGYKIFVVTLTYTGQSGFLLRHFMYDSTRSSWELLLDLNRDCRDVSLLRFCSVVFEGVYYCVSGGDLQAYEIYAYDMKQESWVSPVKMKIDPKTTKVLFVVSNERLLLIASVLEDRSWCFRSSRVDCMDDDSAEYCVADFAWNRHGSALTYQDSLLLASSGSLAVVDLKEFKTISVISISERYKYGMSMAKASFDAQAIV